jgi:hypothetical protein
MTLEESMTKVRRQKNITYLVQSDPHEYTSTSYSPRFEMYSLFGEGLIS